MTEQERARTTIAIVGGGPSGLFVYKHIIETLNSDFAVDIFEAQSQLGGGMPYSAEGANAEHITNVSSNELPPLVDSFADWIETLPPGELEKYDIDPEEFNEHRVLPRLLFGEYLARQFDALLSRGRSMGIHTAVHRHCRVVDIRDRSDRGAVELTLLNGDRRDFDYAIICTGHAWPRAAEGAVAGYFDSPYPPSKLAQRLDHPIAIRGSSLTAVDAIRTLARHNGSFADSSGTLRFTVSDSSPRFKIVMHSLHGLLPCIRFHTESPELGTGSLISDDDVAANMRQNDGFLSLDFVFDKNFKEPLRDRDPAFYGRIKDMTIEEFVDEVMTLRESIDAFSLFKGEYAEAQKSIRREQSIHWKELLSALSFAMNYPAKHMSAEDMLRHQRVLKPLISIVIAFVPQSSARELIALHDAGHIDIVDVGPESHVEPRDGRGAIYHYVDGDGRWQRVGYETFIDCIGQPPLSLQAFPFNTLVTSGAVVPARLRFRSANNGERLRSAGDAAVLRATNGDYLLTVPGMAITDNFEVIDSAGTVNPRIYMMAVPYIGGFNPDYSGLDFCDRAGGLVVQNILSTRPLPPRPPSTRPL